MFESKRKGFRMEDAANQYGVGLSTVYKIVQNGKKVLGSPLRDSAKTQRKASELHLQLEKRLIQWIKDNKTYKAIKQASFSYFILYLRKTPSKRKLPIREKKGATNFSLIRSFDCTYMQKRRRFSSPPHFSLQQKNFTSTMY